MNRNLNLRNVVVYSSCMIFGVTVTRHIEFGHLHERFRSKRGFFPFVLADGGNHSNNVTFSNPSTTLRPSSLVINYENRIRDFSSPEKVFCYFASHELLGSPLMTFDDFVLSITPNLTREFDGSEMSHKGMSSSSAVGASGSLTSASVKNMNDTPEFLEFRKNAAVERAQKLEKNARKLSIDLSGDGLMSFSEYLFIFTLLSIPDSDFELTFMMFDQDGNGTVDCDEFLSVMQHMRKRSGVAQTNRLGTAFVTDRNAPICETFFGPNRDRKLDFKQFSEFVRSLQAEIWELEFYVAAAASHSTSSPSDIALEHRNPQKEFVSLTKFLEMVVHYAGDRAEALRERIHDLKDEFSMDEHHISLEQWCNFNMFIQEWERAANAIELFRSGENAVYWRDFLRVFKAITNSEMDPHAARALLAILGGTEEGERFKVNADTLWPIIRRRVDRFRKHPTSPASTLQCLQKCIWP